MLIREIKTIIMAMMTLKYDSIHKTINNISYWIKYNDHSLYIFHFLINHLLVYFIYHINLLNLIFTILSSFLNQTYLLLLTILPPRFTTIYRRIQRERLRSLTITIPRLLVHTLICYTLVPFPITFTQSL